VVTSVFQLGSVDPVSYHSFSPSDITLKVINKENNLDRWNVGLIQAFSYEHDLLTTEVEGTIIFHIIDWVSYLSNIQLCQKDNCTFLFECNNEYGNGAVFVLEDFKLTKSSLGIGIDGITIESKYQFKAKNTIGWQPRS
jgi:hypothetical protein